MGSLSRIRFLALNYGYLQGLKMIPIGVMELLIAVWTNRQTGPNRDLTLPFLILILGSIVYWLMDRYYRRTFGTVKPPAVRRNTDILISLFFVVLALAAFWVDTSRILSISLFGISLAIFLFLDYLRITRQFGGRILWIYPFSSLILLVISLLPLFGPANWWQPLGIRAQELAILMIIGGIIIITGIWSHFQLIRLFNESEDSRGWGI